MKRESEVTLRELALTFKCVGFGNEAFFDLYLAFGKIDNEMIKIFQDEDNKRKMGNTGKDGATLSRAPSRGYLTPERGEVDKGVVQKQPPVPYEAYMKAARLRKEADIVFSVYRHEIEEIATGRRCEAARTVQWDEVDTKWRDAEETRF